MDTININLVGESKEVNIPINSIKLTTNTDYVVLRDSSDNKVRITNNTIETEVKDVINVVRVTTTVYENINNTLVNNHSLLVNLSNDDHLQYLNNNRGDARYHRLNTITAHDVEYASGISVYDKIAVLGEEPETLEYIISGGYF
jgi:hypothetical protein